jgi:hypothetical protein
MGISRTGGPGGVGWAGAGWPRDGQQDGAISEGDVSASQSPAHRLFERRERGPSPSGFPTEKVQHTSKALENSNKVPELSDDEYSNMSDDEGGATRDLNSVKYLYCDKTWRKWSFEYVPP